MPKKYHIEAKAAPPRFYPVGKYATIEFREECAGSCKKCVKNNCVYNIFKDNYLHHSKMEEPEYLYLDPPSKKIKNLVALDCSSG